jgi:hypothetical protein
MLIPYEYRKIGETVASGELAAAEWQRTFRHLPFPPQLQE